MQYMKGYYGIIQYCPDSSRAEAANVGVILFCPRLRFIEARTSRGNDRVRRFFGPDLEFDLERVNAAKKAIEYRLNIKRDEFQSLEDLVKYISAMGNELQVTEPRPLKLLDPNKELKTLFDELVGGRSRKEKADALEPPGASILEKRFSCFPDRIEIGKTVEIPITKRELKIEYAYRNGAMNLIKTHQFSTRESDAFKSAHHLAISGDLLSNTREPDGAKRKLIVVSLQNGQESQTVEQKIGLLLKQYNTRFVPHDAQNEFADEVEKDLR